MTSQDFIPNPDQSQLVTNCLSNLTFRLVRAKQSAAYKSHRLEDAINEHQRAQAVVAALEEEIEAIKVLGDDAFCEDDCYELTEAGIAVLAVQNE